MPPSRLTEGVVRRLNRRRSGERRCGRGSSPPARRRGEAPRGRAPTSVARGSTLARCSGVSFPPRIREGVNTPRVRRSAPAPSRRSAPLVYPEALDRDAVWGGSDAATEMLRLPVLTEPARTSQTHRNRDATSLFQAFSHNQDPQRKSGGQKLL